MLLTNSPAVQRIPIDQLRLSATPVRRHPKKEIEKLRKLLAAQGQVLPVLATPNGEIIYLEPIWIALKASGATEVDALIVTGKSPTELAALQLALNRIPLDGSWHAENVRAVLQDLVDADFDLDLTGFDAPEIEHYLNLDIPEPNLEPAEADIPLRQARAISKPGDIWALGANRVGCGSASDGAFVTRVLDGKIAGAGFIEPREVEPCTLSRTDQGDAEFTGGGASSVDEYFALLKNCLVVLKQSCAPAALVYACVDWRQVMAMTLAGHACDMPLQNICVWTKPTGAIGGIYRDAHELVCVFSAGGEMLAPADALVHRARTRSNVWSYPAGSPRGKRADTGSHPAGIPVALIADALCEVTRRGAMVLDTFLRTGSTLMAAERTGRICCGVEQDPLSLDVTIRRWQKATGRDAILMQTGEPFNAAGGQRLLMPPTEDP